jgi:hypothetical protein
MGKFYIPPKYEKVLSAETSFEQTFQHYLNLDSTSLNKDANFLFGLKLKYIDAKMHLNIYRYLPDETNLYFIGKL